MALNLALAEHIEQKGRFTEKLSDVTGKNIRLECRVDPER